MLYKTDCAEFPFQFITLKETQIAAGFVFEPVFVCEIFRYQITHMYISAFGCLSQTHELGFLCLTLVASQ